MSEYEAIMDQNVLSAQCLLAALVFAFSSQHETHGTHWRYILPFNECCSFNPAIRLPSSADLCTLLLSLIAVARDSPYFSSAALSYFLPSGVHH